ncbi:hypothetical protein RSO01_62540 [Reyranella soli]|uniref:Uncharacterized protein n=1 Tax=Reyranella soli TaxID=1230389 RepID=A0A512NJF6_9HYPH|nr:hypothetical protein RSO01_62540 [Reyranella soli]
MGDAELLTKADHPNWSQSFLANNVADRLVEWGPAKHEAKLKNAATGQPCGSNRLSVSNSGGDGFFQKDMLVCAKSLFRDETMKMIRQHDEHDVDRWVFKCVHEIAAGLSFRKADVR